ncbi:MAG: hypothetical protein PHO08_19475 [Methylococcales bacterium]|nr:hypothetical protein [Methylococcales bacterium]MDD5630989.1 hypothetical protein [Methylococcales bacterium]
MSDQDPTVGIELILKKLDDLLKAKTSTAVMQLQKEIDESIKKTGEELKEAIKPSRDN